MNFTWLMRAASAFTPKPLTPFKQFRTAGWIYNYMLRLGEGGHWANVPPPLQNPAYASVLLPINCLILARAFSYLLTV